MRRQEAGYAIFEMVFKSLMASIQPIRSLEKTGSASSFYSCCYHVGSISSTIVITGNPELWCYMYDWGPLLINMAVGTLFKANFSQKCFFPFGYSKEGKG